MKEKTLEDILIKEGFVLDNEESDEEFHYPSYVKGEKSVTLCSYKENSLVTDYVIDLPGITINDSSNLFFDGSGGIFVNLERNPESEKEIIDKFMKALDIQKNLRKYRLNLIRKYLEIEEWAYKELDPALEALSMKRSFYSSENSNNIISINEDINNDVIVVLKDNEMEDYLFSIQINLITLETNTYFHDTINSDTSINLYNLDTGFIVALLEDIFD